MVTSSPEEADPADPDRAERLARHRLVLQELTEMGMDAARVLHRAVMDDPTPQAACEIALAFTRLSRAVRVTVALEDRIGEDRPVRARPAKVEAPQVMRGPPSREEVARARANYRRDKVGAIVEETIELEAARRGEAHEADRLYDELNERLVDPEDIADFDHLPFAELVQRICRDLGVAFNPDLLAPEDWDVPPHVGRGIDLMLIDPPPDPASRRPQNTPFPAPPGERRDPDDKARIWPGLSP